MQPQNDKLTPKQLRAVLAAFLLIFLIFLLFGGIVGYIALKGEQARVARRQARIAQIQRAKIARTKERIERKKQAKANAGKPAKKSKMANKIARGTTGQAEFISTSGGYGPTFSWYIYSEGQGHNVANNTDPNWGATVDGVVTVPSNTPLGSYQLTYIPAGTGTGTRYYFEVVAAVTPTPPSGFKGTGWYGGGDITASYFDALGNRTQEYTNNQIHPASNVVWTDAGFPCGPYSEGCEAVVACFEGAPVGVGYHCVTHLDGSQAVIQTATMRDYLETFEGCNPANIPSQYLSISSAFESEDAAAHFCQNRHVRYRCNRAGRCEWFLTDDATEGFASCEAVTCSTPPPPPLPPTYERYVCVMRGGVKSCVKILTTNVSEGYADCAAANCSGSTLPVTVYTRYRCDGNGNCESFETTDATLGFADCESASCQPPPPVFFTRYRCNAQGSCESFQTNDATEGFASCEAANCPAPSGNFYWCVAGVVHSGTNPPAGVTTYTSAQACLNAGCTIEPPVYTRYRCDESGHCQSFLTSNENEGYHNCESANCTGIVQPTDYLRYHCDEDGACREFYTFDPLEGFEDCVHANCGGTPPPTTPCTYLDHPIANVTAAGETQLKFSLSRQGNPGWQLVITHAIEGVPRPNPIPQITTAAWNWSVPRTLGDHHFIAELSKPGCTEVYITDLRVKVTGDGTSGGGDPFWCVDGACEQAQVKPSGTVVSGPYATNDQCTTACSNSGGSDCPPCPPEPDPLGEEDCAIGLSIQLPATGASLRNFAMVRVQVSDPDEETDPCHPNYGRLCNAEANGPDLQLFLNEYHVPLTWKHVSGSPLNGIWQALFDTRDYSNGAHQLYVTGRGVGCCRLPNNVSVTLANTLQGNIFYRDTLSNGRDGFLIGDAIVGVETRALEENTSRRYWEQWGVRSGPLLDGPYQHADWDKHQMVLPVQGAKWEAQDERFERRTYSAHVTFRLPLAREVRFRRKWTPQFALSAFDLHAQTVAKIRPISLGRHYAFTTNPAQVWVYDGDTVKRYGNFGVEPTIDEGELGEDEEAGDFNDLTLDRSGSNIYAPDAIDCAVYGGDSTGDKVYVVVPASDDLPRGEVFAFDPDEKQVALEYGIRRENRVPRFIEAVGNRVICLYVHDPALVLPQASKRTRAYDLTFATPQLLWQLETTATLCSVDDGTLLIGCGSKLYSTDGATAPTLVHDFGAAITVASKSFVGLENGQVWKQTANSWHQVHARIGAIGGVSNWSAGTNGEAQIESPRGVVAGQGAWLVGERTNGTWQDERELRLPLDLATGGKSVTRVSALDHFSLPVAAPSGTETGEAISTPQKDERLLVGTANSGLLFVYQRSLLSEKDGAIPVSHDTTPRLFPFPRRI